MNPNRQFCTSLTLSPWYPAGTAVKEAPEESGIYLIRILGPEVMAYVGESGALCNRLRNWSSLNDPKISASEWKRDSSLKSLVLGQSGFTGDYEIAFASASENPDHNLRDRQDRKACESWVLWQIRVQTGRSTMANHVRTTRKGCLPVNDMERSVRIGPGKEPLHIGIEPAPSTPLRLSGSPPSSNWMNLPWSPFLRRRDLDEKQRPMDSKYHDPSLLTRGPVLYRVREPSQQEIVQLGYVKEATKETRDVLDGLPDGMQVSWHNLPPSVYKYQCHEQRDDLIGAYYHQNRRAPGL